MPYQFDHTTGNRLNVCHPDLIELAKAVIKRYDFRVMCGHRDEKAQNEAFLHGNSEKQWPNSKHNKFPSEAIDVLPNCLVVNGKINWDDNKAFDIAYNELANIIFEEADKLGIHIKWLGDSHQDGSKTKEKYRDLPHFELVIRQNKDTL